MPVFPRSPKDSRKTVKMKREVPVAQFFPLEAPSKVFAGSRGAAPRGQTLNGIMKYIFNWPVKGEESYVHTCL